MQKKQSADTIFLPFVLFFIYTLFCTFSLLLISGFGKITFSDASLILISIVISSISFLFYLFKSSRILYIAIISAGGVLLLLSESLGHVESASLRVIQGVTEIFIKYTQASAELTVLCVIALALSLFGYFFIVKFPDPAALSLFCGVMFIFQLLTGGSQGTVYFIFLLAILFITMFLRTYVRVDRASFVENTGLRSVFAFAAVFVTISTVIASLLPYPNAPIMENSIHSASKGNLSFFSLGNEDGYEEESMLGGKLELSDDEILTVRTQQRIRLIGSIKTEYTGNSWQFGERTNEKYKKGASADFAEISHNLETAELYDTLLFNKAEITVKKPAGHTVFAPPLITSFKMKKSATLYIANDGSIVSRQPITKDLEYTVESGALDFNSIDVLSMLRSSHKGIYSNAVASDDMSAEELANKSESAYSECLSLPKNLPNRVKELAEDITKDCENDYDKAIAIQEYLSLYKYTTTPPDPLEDSDFVDTFLFEQKEGYCSYFATSMAVLARSVGIPARYVEGYALPSDYTQSGETYIYSVTGKEAHSWPQLYFEGIGWVDFEPTPPYSYLEQGEDIPQEIFKNPDDATSFNGALKEDPTSEKETEAEEPLTENESESPTDEEIPATTADQGNTDADTEKPEVRESFTSTVWFKLLIVLLIPVALLLILIGFSVLMKQLSDRKLAKICLLGGNEAASLLFGEIESAYKYIGICRGNDETAGDFLRTASAIIGLDSTCDKIIEQALYSDISISDAELSVITDYHKKQKIAIKKDLPKLKKFILSTLLHRV